MSEEIWKNVVGFPAYQVSNIGRVRNTKNGKLLKGFLCKRGYPKVGLSNGDKCKMKFIHRILAEAFIPNPDGKTEINHIDGVKDNCRLENLEWVTRSENMIHAFGIGLCKPSDKQKEMLSRMSRTKIGAKHHGSKKVIDISTGRIYPSITEAAASVGFSMKYVSLMLLNYKPNKTSLRFSNPF